MYGNINVTLLILTDTRLMLRSWDRHLVEFLGGPIQFYNNQVRYDEYTSKQVAYG
jgi:hypothetical protein